MFDLIERNGNDLRAPGGRLTRAAALGVSERMLLFCVASNTDWKHTAIPGEIVNTMVVKGVITRDAGDILRSPDRGRAVLHAMLPDL